MSVVKHGPAGKGWGSPSAGAVVFGSARFSGQDSAGRAPVNPGRAFHSCLT